MTSTTARIQRPTSVQAAHSKQKLRYNEQLHCWQVYTFLSPDIDKGWKWFNITKETAEWYKDAHHTPVIPFEREKEHGNS